MYFSSKIYVYCFVFVSTFTPSFIQCMDDRSSDQAETSPMDIDPSIEQIVTTLADQVDEREVDESEEKITFSYPVTNAQALDAGFVLLLGFLRERSTFAEQMTLELVNGIEKIYGTNVAAVEAVIQKNRNALDPELQKIFDCCLDKCRGKIQRFAACQSCSFYVSMALFSWVIYLAVQEFYL